MAGRRRGGRLGRQVRLHLGQNSLETRAQPDVLLSALDEEGADARRPLGGEGGAQALCACVECEGRGRRGEAKGDARAPMLTRRAMSSKDTEA